MTPTVLHHMIVSSSLPYAALRLSMEPNARHELLLYAVSSMPLFGAGAPCPQGVVSPARFRTSPKHLRAHNFSRPASFVAYSAC